jgi:hypothetical protein
MNTTTIYSNGSKWAGQEPDSIAELIAVLEREPLDPMFEAYGDFVFDGDPAIPAGLVRVWGNFLNVSHVFCIEGTPESLEPLITAIRANQTRPDYLAASK